MNDRTMTSMTRGTPSTGVAAAPARDHRDARVTQWRVVFSEWIKLWSLPSTYMAVGVTLFGVVGLGCLLSAIAGHNARSGGTFQPYVPLEGVMLAQLAVGVLGVLIVTNEYHAGLIRATFAAVPRRLPVFWAKCGLVTAVTFVIGLAGALVAFFAGEAIVAGDHVSLHITQQHALRDVVGLALYLAVVALLSAGVGWAVRSTAGALATVFGILLVVPIIGNVLPLSWAIHIDPYLPTNAGESVVGFPGTVNPLGPWSGISVFAGYAVLAALAGLLAVRRRDA